MEIACGVLVDLRVRINSVFYEYEYLKECCSAFATMLGRRKQLPLSIQKELQLETLSRHIRGSVNFV